MSLLPLSQRQCKALKEHLQAQGLDAKRGDVVEVVAEAFAFLLTATVDQVAYGTGLSSSLVKRTLKQIRDQRPEQNV